MSTDELPARFTIEFFLSYESLKSRKRRILFTNELHTRASTRKRLSPPGLVCHQKKGDMRKKRKEKKKTKEGGLSPQEGDVRKKKRKKEKKKKRPRKARRWLPRRQGSVCPQPRISFFGSQVVGFGSSPSRLKYRLLRDLVYEEAMCEGSSGNGLLYAAKAVP